MVQLIKDVVRGTPVRFTARFFNIDGELMTPDNVTLYVSCRVNNVQNTSNVAMTQVNTYYWIATWNSANADAGVIDWAIRADADDDAVQQGSFRVLANRATTAAFE